MSTLDTLLDKELNNGYTVLTIDEPSRTIQYDGKELILGVEDDKYAERIYFVCPKFVGDEIDVSLKTNRVDVKFENGFGDTYFTQCADVELQDDGNVKFSWLITEKVAVTYGNVKFSVCIKEMNGESVVVKEWHTAPCVGKVMTGVDVGIEDLEVITDTTYPTIQLIEQVKSYETQVAGYEAEVEAYRNDVDDLATLIGNSMTTNEANRKDIDSILENGATKADLGVLEAQIATAPAKAFKVIEREELEAPELLPLNIMMNNYNELLIIIRSESTGSIDVGISTNNTGASGFICKKTVTGTSYTQIMMNKVMDETGAAPKTYISWNMEGSTAWEEISEDRNIRWYSSTNDLSPLVTVVVCGR